MGHLAWFAIVYLLISCMDATHAYIRNTKFLGSGPGGLHCAMMSQLGDYGSVTNPNTGACSPLDEAWFANKTYDAGVYSENIETFIKLSPPYIQVRRWRQHRVELPHKHGTEFVDHHQLQGRNMPNQILYAPMMLDLGVDIEWAFEATTTNWQVYKDGSYYLTVNFIGLVPDINTSLEIELGEATLHEVQFYIVV